MSVEIKVPELPESVADAVVAKWYKKPGEAVARGENIVDLETDKVMLEVPAQADGVLEAIDKPEGETVKGHEVLGRIKEGAAPAKQPAEAEPAKSAKPETKAAKPSETKADLSPAVRRLVAEHNLDASTIQGTGKDGRITKADVEAALKGTAAPAAPIAVGVPGERTEKRVPMSRMRAKIAERLVTVQQNTAMLTTFNEINMKPVMDMRVRYKEKFEKTHGVRLGLMSFFVTAAVEALKHYPSVNASIDADELVYHGYFDVGIAVSSERGLVVPILRDADTMSMADVEHNIRNYAAKAKENKLTLEEITGGTFTITNGGVFGSMLSTPILNAPQSAILGMHNIVKRPVAENDDVVVRPVMYTALTYDHRIIDGRESVGFLVMIKELLEDPSRFLLDL